MQRQEDQLPKISNLLKFPSHPLTADDIIDVGPIHEDNGLLYSYFKIKRKNKQQQTKYHDADVQTKIWVPPFTKRHLPDPELIVQKDWQFDIVPGESQVDALNVFREQTKWEKKFLHLEEKRGNREMLIKQTKILERFYNREQEMKKIQEHHLKRFGNEFYKRRCFLQKINDLRLQKLWEEKKREKEKLKFNLVRQFSHNLRVIENRRERVSILKKKRDLSKDYCDYASKVYAYPENSSVNKYEDFGTSQYLNTLNGLLELETKLYEACKEEGVPAKRISLSEQRALKFFKGLKDYKSAKETSEKKMELKGKEMIRQQQTPTISIQTEKEFRKRYAILILQAILRGRAVQCKMMKDLSKHIALVEELHSTNSMCIADEEEISKRTAIIKEYIENYQIKCLREILWDEFVDEWIVEIVLDIIIFLAESQLYHLEELMKRRRLAASTNDESVESLSTLQETKDQEKELESPMKSEEEEEVPELPAITAAIVYLNPAQLDMLKYFKKLRCRKHK